MLSADAARSEVGCAGFGGDGGARVDRGQPCRAGRRRRAAGGWPPRRRRSQPAAVAYAADNDRHRRRAARRPLLARRRRVLRAGLLLSLTPCVLPMVPILSSIIVGAGRAVSRGARLRAGRHYSLGMALVYTALGVAAGLAGEGLAARAAERRGCSARSRALLVALALSMFGVYELQMPAALQTRLTDASQRLPAGQHGRRVRDGRRCRR